MRSIIVLGAVWISAGTALAQGTIRDTRWSDREYTFEDRRDADDADRYEVTLAGGHATRVRVNGERRNIEFAVSQVEYGDYAGDRRDEAIVVLTAREETRSGPPWETAFLLFFRERSNAADLVVARRIRPPESVVVARRHIEIRARRGLPNTPYPCTELLAISETGLTQERERCR